MADGFETSSKQVWETDICLSIAYLPESVNKTWHLLQIFCILEPQDQNAIEVICAGKDNFRSKMHNCIGVILKSFSKVFELTWEVLSVEQDAEVSHHPVEYVV